MKARKWVLASRFDGVPKDDDVQLREEELPELKDGGERISVPSGDQNASGIHVAPSQLTRHLRL